MLFISKSLKNILPDIELVKFKQTCLKIISSVDTPNEGHFGLVKIFCYEERYKEAVHHLKHLIKSDPEDSSYLTWLLILKFKLLKTQKQAVKLKMLCLSKSHSGCLMLKSGKIEALWTLMRLSQSGLLEVGKDIEKPENFASAILKIDPYYGYLAWSHLVSERKQQIMLANLMTEFPSSPECYILAWNHCYYKTKNYQKALDIILQAYLLIKEFKDYEILIGLNYAKTLQKIGNIEKAIELLQVEYNKRSVYIVYLYHYSRICVKAGNHVFLGSALGALTECLRICSDQRHGHIYYWLSRAYLRLDEKILAFKAIQKSLISFSRTLENPPSDPSSIQRINQKISELKSNLESFSINPQIFPRLKFILNNFEPSLIEEFSSLIKSVKEIDHLYGEVLESEALWKFDYKTDALKSLYNNFKTTRVQMKSFFLIVRYLSEESDYSNIKKLCEKMIKKCRSPSIPVQVWLKVHLVFAKSLIQLGNIPRAILIYKCLAQVQPAPYISDLLYTRILQQANNIEDLLNVTSIVQKARQFQDPELNFKRLQLLSSKRNLSSIVIDDDAREIQASRVVCDAQDQPLGSRTPEPLPKARFSKIPCGDNANPGFSVSIFYLFLYKIGKISAKFNINIEDGLFAMHDFLILHHYWMQEGIESDEKAKAKALYWMGVLYHHQEKYGEAAATFKESLCMLFQLGLDEMADKVQKALKEYQALGRKL
jgi:tetratricopeptide (TPR) repeat protein